ncbi:DUF943 family protein [Mixta gaviniae]|uniref:DUF943 domain-containing protein n=1 Tax=Mixta gaviniae TaxID=665914 RepID=A0A2L0IIE5_9GAMM|nr:DUF943 family protein [Mixta gaviniae]AUX94338.1 hypothetical protein C2E15_15525 [Mixta gaviniae]
MKKLPCLILIFTLLSVGHPFFYPTKLIGVHQPSDNVIVLIVDHFPWTKKGKISWWENNRSKIFNRLKFDKEKYFIFIYNTHYKKDSGTDQDSDLLCFEDMATEQNCISKENRPLIVWHYPDGHTEYETESLLRRFY